MLCTEKCLLLPFGTGIDDGSRMLLLGVKNDFEGCWKMECFFYFRYCDVLRADISGSGDILLWSQAVSNAWAC